ncbi:hypothetical protein LJK88_12400 [Paenibacillus sp. P26]|nr:hypothetical protein LJK88_12400 [Paenibacillus sp. P26]
MTGRIQVSASYRGGYDPARLIPAEDALLDRWVRRCGWEWDAKYEERKVIWHVRFADGDEP